MKTDEVPQQKGVLGNVSKEVQYALDENGRYRQVMSDGWEPKDIVNGLSWEVIKEQAAEAHEKIESGKASPLLFYMRINQMNRSLLASYMDISQLQVWWHLKPLGFKQLKSKRLRQYAHLFGVSIEELKNPDYQWKPPTETTK
ncbi:MAG: hypothetical protein ACQESW_06125 [Bacteroidota bacterium]